MNAVNLSVRVLMSNVTFVSIRTTIKNFSIAPVIHTKVLAVSIGQWILLFIFSLNRKRYRHQSLHCPMIRSFCCWHKMFRNFIVTHFLHSTHCLTFTAGEYPVFVLVALLFLVHSKEVKTSLLFRRTNETRPNCLLNQLSRAVCMDFLAFVRLKANVYGRGVCM